MANFFRGECSRVMVLLSVFISQELYAQVRDAEHSSRYSSEAAVKRIEAILNQPVRRRLSYAPEQLDIICDQLQEEYGIPIVFDKAALDEVAISPESEVSLDVDGISLRAALNLMFMEPGLEDLCYSVEDEVLLITTKDNANATLVTKVYRVDDLLGSSPPRFNDTQPTEDPESLIDVLVATIEHDSWMENGTGDGEIQYLAPGMLVVSQTRHLHEKIESLLGQIRATKQKIVGSTPATTLPPVAATQGFVLEVEFGENSEQQQQQLSEAIKKSVHWSEASTGDVKQFWIKVLPDRLLVRHVPLILAQVETVLWDMNVLDRKRHARGGLGCQPLTSGSGRTSGPALAEDAAAGDDGC